MSYSEMYKNQLAQRQAKRAKVTPMRPQVKLADLGKVAPEALRISAHRHFENLCRSYEAGKGESMLEISNNSRKNYALRREINRLARQWNFELPPELN